MQDLGQVQAVRVELEGKTYILKTDLQGVTHQRFQAAGVRSPLAGDDDQLSCKMKAECSAKLILNNSNLSNFNKFRLSMLENEFDTKS